MRDALASALVAAQAGHKSFRPGRGPAALEPPVLGCARRYGRPRRAPHDARRTARPHEKSGSEPYFEKANPQTRVRGHDQRLDRRTAECGDLDQRRRGERDDYPSARAGAASDEARARRLLRGELRRTRDGPLARARREARPTWAARDRHHRRRRLALQPGRGVLWREPGAQSADHGGAVRQLWVPFAEDRRPELLPAGLGGPDREVRRHGHHAPAGICEARRSLRRLWRKGDVVTRRGRGPRAGAGAGTKAARADPHGAGMTELEVNGQMRGVSAGPDTPLLYVLRNDFGLVGSRFGCGTGQCGACFVIVEGKAVPSCDTPLWSVAGKKVTTVEGLAKGGELHPVQKALLAEQAAQCGYCISGIAVAAAAFLSSNHNPSEQQVREALDRNLCRCGAHNRVVRAVLRAAKEMQA